MRRRTLDSMGHLFGPSLACVNAGCDLNWFSFQSLPVKCSGVRAEHMGERQSRLNSKRANERITEAIRVTEGQPGDLH